MFQSLLIVIKIDRLTTSLSLSLSSHMLQHKIAFVVLSLGSADEEEGHYT